MSMLLLVFCFCSPMQFDDDEKTKDIIKNVRRTLSYLHFSPQDVNDDFSGKVYNAYIESLDPLKIYFKGSDMELFDNYKLKMDDFFNNEDLSFYQQSVDTLYTRVDELEVLTEKILENPLDYTSNEIIYFDFDESSYASTQAEWENNWQKRLKYSILQDILLMEESVKDTAAWHKKDSVGLDADDFDPRGKSFAQLETCLLYTSPSPRD